MNIIQRPSDHCEDRRGAVRAGFIIIHYTETQTLVDAEDYFLARRAHPDGGRVSTHYMIDYDGTVIQYVPEDKRAWHAGVSYWAGIEDINSHSIGIELVNPGRKYGYQAFTAPQMAALVELCRGIAQRHHISPHRVLGHSDIAPLRKKDPGELFDWTILARAGLAAWPAPDDEDRRVAHDYLRDEASLREAFVKAGYDPKADLAAVITAFQRHFCPEVFQYADRVGKADHAMAAKLHWLVRSRPDF